MYIYEGHVSYLWRHFPTRSSEHWRITASRTPHDYVTLLRCGGMPNSVRCLKTVPFYHTLFSLMCVYLLIIRTVSCQGNTLKCDYINVIFFPFCFSAFSCTMFSYWYAVLSALADCVIITTSSYRIEFNCYLFLIRSWLWMGLVHGHVMLIIQFHNNCIFAFVSVAEILFSS